MKNTYRNIYLDFPLRFHILYWTASVAIWVIFSVLFYGDFLEAFTNKMCYLPSQMMVTYAFLYFVLPAFLERSYWKGLLGFLLVTYSSTTLARFLKIYVYETVLNRNEDKESIIEILTQTTPLMVQYMIWVFMTPILTIMIVLFINHMREKERVLVLQKEKNMVELEFLKAQLHPHFLFNTLNNLYTLAIHGSPKTAIISQRLYDILDYMFHRGKKLTIRLEEEIKLLSNYIELQKIRYDNNLLLNFKVDIEHANCPIVPLMLLSLVENAFKHGVSGEVSTPRINISLHEKEKQLAFYIENSKSQLVFVDKSGYKKGIGIKNIKRQLELLYPERYQYKYEDAEDYYKVDLTIDLRAPIQLEQQLDNSNLVV